VTERPQTTLDALLSDTDYSVPVTYDTETVGFHGLAVLIQVAKGDGNVLLHEVFLCPASETISLIDWLMQHMLIGFNLTFDHFHLCKLRTLFSMMDDKSKLPIDCLNELAYKEKWARDGLCLKPKSACDLLVLSSEGKHSALMLERNELRIRAVPTMLAEETRLALNQKLQFPDIFFARKKDPSQRFISYPNKRAGFSDLVLKFAPSSALKELVTHFFGTKTTKFKDIPCPEFPPEKKKGYRPFGFWRDYIEAHIEHWHSNPVARDYAYDDVINTRLVWKQFGSPEGGDVNSILACMVGAVRWHGFMVDMEKVMTYLADCEARMNLAPRYTTKSKAYLLECLDEDERELIQLKSTKKQLLEELTESYEGHELGRRAALVLDARRAKYDYDMCRKLMEAGRFHAAAKVVGSLSGRKSGAGGDFNSQGISKKKVCREIFTFKWEGMVLCGGDFESQEMTIADAVFDDEQMHADLLEDTSIHAVFGTYCFPDYDYDQIKATSGTVNDLYKKAKSAVFSTLYGGTASTYKRRLNISMDIATEAFNRYMARYPQMAAKRDEIFGDFEMMSQPNGTGTAVVLKEPNKIMIESMFGFKRDFAPEFSVVRALTEFAHDMPEELTRWDDEIRLERRRGRLQTPSGCLRSSIYLAAFGIQGGIQRAANNHVIQSSGASVCKELERAIWGLQPAGFHPWQVAPLNMHDEVMVVCRPDRVDELTEIVTKTVAGFIEKIPLLAIDWKNDINSWAET